MKKLVEQIEWLTEAKEYAKEIERLLGIKFNDQGTASVGVAGMMKSGDWMKKMVAHGWTATSGGVVIKGRAVLSIMGALVQLGHQGEETGNY